MVRYFRARCKQAEVCKLGTHMRMEGTKLRVYVIFEMGIYPFQDPHDKSMHENGVELLSVLHKKNCFVKLAIG